MPGTGDPYHTVDGIVAAAPDNTPPTPAVVVHTAAGIAAEVVVDRVAVAVVAEAVMKAEECLYLFLQVPYPYS